LGTKTGWFGWGDPGSSLTFTGPRNIFVRHYPGDSPYDGLDQYWSTGRTAGATSSEILFKDSEVPTYHGSSGGPVYLMHEEINGSIWNNTIVGVVSRQWNSTMTAATRLEPFLDFIDDVLDDDPAPVDRPDLVDRDKWFNKTGSGTAATSARTGQSLSVSAVVSNLGTAAASNVKVRFRLSTDQTYTTSDTLLGNVTLSSISAMSAKTASGTFTIPRSLAGGRYFVVWSIDPDNKVSEYQSMIDENLYNFNYNLGRDATSLTITRSTLVAPARLDNTKLAQTVGGPAGTVSVDHGHDLMMAQAIAAMEEVKVKPIRRK
jgi:hypothetical protein